MTTLSALPNEILASISSYLDGPRDLFCLSLACRRLSEFAKLDGWKALLRGRFGLTGLDGDARNSVHGMTTLCRNWQRKGFLARYLEPSERPISLNTWQPKRWRERHRQTMGYRAYVDSYEEICGEWASRREALAWSAGASIIMRIKTTGSCISPERANDHGPSTQQDQSHVFDCFGHSNSWFTYRIPDAEDGRDDVTALKLLRPHQKTTDFEQAVYGTASGQLAMISMSRDRKYGKTVVQHFETNAEAIGSISLSPSSNPLLAATLRNRSLALFPTMGDRDPEAPVQPLAQIASETEANQNHQFWSCNFLSDDKLAMGLGPSKEPVHVFAVTPDGISSNPIRKFNLEDTYPLGSPSYSRVGYRYLRTSIYPILPIPGTATGGSDAGNVFLSGGYDGVVRLHDMRSPRGFESMFCDQTDDPAVCSLALQGLERVVAGVMRHAMIKVFDLRLSGSHAYQSPRVPLTNGRRKSQSQHANQDNAVNGSVKSVSALSGGWNLFLYPRTPPDCRVYRERYWNTAKTSPVYSLSIPSSTSQNMYAGLEGAVQCLTFHGVADAHPDTTLSQSLTHFADSGAVDIRSSYNPQGDVLSLGMYEQGNEGGLGMQLLVQDGVTKRVAGSHQRRDAAGAKRLDERWRNVRENGDERNRGWVDPQKPRRGLGSRRYTMRGGSNAQGRST